MQREELQLQPTPALRLGAGGNRAVRGLPAACPQHLPALSTGQMRGWLSPALLGIFVPKQRSLEASPAPLVQVTTCHLTPLESRCSCSGS